MPRQPYSAAVPSTGGRLPPLVPEGFCPPKTGGTEGGVKTIEERLGKKGGAFLKGKEGRVGFRKNSFWLKILQMSAMKVCFQIAECS
jgi:hypothetical protein